IGTIHSFCGEVLRDFALRAGRPPAGTVLEEGEAAALAAEAVHDALLQALDEGSVPGLRELLSEWSSGEVEGWVRRLVGNGGVLQKLNAGVERLGPREATLLELATLAAERLYERLERTGAIDFDRMIVGTRDLIAEHEDVRRALRRRIHTLIVDEFQDVDPVQQEIAYLLAEPERGSAATPRLMLVGDPKQSIYRFRRADVTVWTRVERDFRDRGMGDVVTLEESRRSVAPVLGFVDAVIGPELDRPLDGKALREFEVPYVALKTTRVDGPSDRAVELLVVPPNDDDGKCRKVEEVRRADAAAVARRALELHGEGVAWREMAVLLASWNGLELYQGALEAAGVPTYALRGDGFYSRREVVDLIVALEAIRDPRDDRALFGYLRGPMVGVSDEALLRIARSARRPYWDHLAGVDVGDEAEPLARGVETLRRHAALRDRIRLDSLITSLLNETGYIAFLSLLEGDGPQALANVRRFRAFAAAARESSLGDFLRMVREVRERGDRVGDAPLYGENDDVVTITSVHSAKGLEWRVVFWADLVRSVQDRAEKLIVGRETMVLGEPDTPAREQPDRWQELAALESAEVRAEQKRLWYVAATRAKDRLVLSGVPALSLIPLAEP
ncbi:MAG: UvrD-helicase domain-containing protein, partial [Gemmatimonadetes bacterium]|nr:UvrD-helicase domain-containing protein [Gemmatimonadota bacterium]